MSYIKKDWVLPLRQHFKLLNVTLKAKIQYILSDAQFIKLYEQFLEWRCGVAEN